MSSVATKGCVVLIDAHSLIFQVFHAIPAMTSPAGMPTNALFGFTKDILSLRTDQKPEILLAVFDHPGPTFRDRLYTEYKAHRAPMPDDLTPQIPLIREMLQAMGVPILSQEGYEADDLIATLARAASLLCFDVLVCTSDKDCRQLIDDRIKLYNLRKKETLDREGLLREWAVTPEQVIDLQTLVGDSVDNIPGVPGIGLKTGAKLLQQFGTLDNLLANVDKIPGAKKQESLRAAAHTITLSRRLVSLATDVPMKFDWEGWRLGDPDYPRLLALFQQWGFHRFADQVRVMSHDRVERQRELFAVEDAIGTESNGHARRRRSPSWQATYHLVDNEADFQAFLTRLREQKRFAIDLETTELEPQRGAIIGYAMCWQPGEAWYLAVGGPEGCPRLDSTATLAALKPILENARVAKVNQNIKYDWLVLRNHGVSLAGVVGDPMVADYLLHAGQRSHSMEDLASRYLDHQVIPITDLIGKRGKNQLRIDEVAPDLVAGHAGEDADVAWRLCELLEPQLRDQSLDKLYQDLEMPLIEVLAAMEGNGIRLDIPLLKRLSKEMTEQLETIEQAIYSLAGRSFNIASPKQLRQVLFDELKLPPQRRTGIKGEASTDQETLERLAAQGLELPRKIVEHRQIAKLKGTYVDALPGLVNPATGRVHASFNQTVAATGRLSSSDPNLQNIPVRTAQGRQIRQAFVPAEGWRLLTADYSQIELRLLAHFCGDPALQKAFADEHDIHATVAAQIFGVAEGQVTADMRRVAKTVNFGVIYGISPHGLAPRLNISLEEAAQFIDAYFARYPRVAVYQKELLARCYRDRYVGTILGRRREISGIRLHSTYQQRNQPEREAINMQIQGSAADLIKVAMLNIYRRLKQEAYQARLLLQIHDELVFEVPPEELQPVAELVRQEMTRALRLQVPLKVDLAAGPNWLDVEDLEL
jgi:DNA polymerase-1